MSVCLAINHLLKGENKFLKVLFDSNFDCELARTDNQLSIFDHFHSTVHSTVFSVSRLLIDLRIYFS